MNPWIEAARPKTLSAGIVPVFVGSALAFHDGHFHLLIFFACLIGALTLQIATNYINDASDFLKGADTHERLGPKRMAQAGLLTPKALFIGAGLMFALATFCGIYLISQAGLFILAIGIFSILGAIAYTAGPFPLAYYGLGDFFVLLFFGVIAVCGTYFSHTTYFSLSSLISSLIVGLSSVAIIAVNNTRDILEDSKTHKRTLAVRFGENGSKNYFQLILYFSFLLTLILAVYLKSYTLLLPFLTLPLARQNIIKMKNAKSGENYNQLLASTAKFQLIFCFLLGLALIYY